MKYILPILTAIAGIVIAVFFMRSCHPSPGTVIKYDTFIRKVRDTVHDSIPVPYKVEIAGKPIQITKHDTAIIHDTLHLTAADSARIYRDYFVVRSYRDTLRHKYGYTVISNAVTQNKLTSQSAVFDFSVPEITKTITEKKRLGYVGIDLGVGNGIGMGGIDFIYIDRKERMYKFRTDYTTLGSVFIGGGISTKITLK